MSTSSPSCPYCNATLTAVTREGDKVRCPRCGESLAAHLAETLPNASEPTPDRATQKAWTNRRIGMYVLGGMTLVALAALAFALLTQNQRRSRDPREPAAIYFLPSSSNFALGIHVKGLLEDPDAARLLEEPRPGVLDWMLGTMQTRTKLALSDLDQIVLGTTLADKLPTVVMVVQTLKPYSREEIAKAMHPITATQHELQPVYRFNTPPYGEAFLWCRAPSTLIFLWRPESVDPKDLDTIPKGDDMVVPPSLADYLVMRQEKNALAWLVGDFTALAQLKAAIEPLRAAVPQFRKLPTIPEPWPSIAFGGLSLVNESARADPVRVLTLRGQFRTTDSLIADFVAKHLQAITVPGEVSNRATPPPPEARESDLWVLWQLRVEVEGLKQWMAGK